ncbi:hypothetical protein FGG08_007660, partial [Glutinoglossum americanum]
MAVTAQPQPGTRTRILQEKRRRRGAKEVCDAARAFRGRGWNLRQGAKAAKYAKTISGRQAHPLAGDARHGHPRVHGVAPAQVVRGLLVGGEAFGRVVDLVEVEAVRIVERLGDVELAARWFLAAVLGIVARGGDERRTVLGDNVDGDGDDVGHSGILFTGEEEKRRREGVDSGVGPGVAEQDGQCAERLAHRRRQFDLAARARIDRDVGLADLGARGLADRDVDVHGIAAVADPAAADGQGRMIAMAQGGAELAVEVDVGQGQFAAAHQGREVDSEVVQGLFVGVVRQGRHMRPEDHPGGVAIVEQDPS